MIALVSKNETGLSIVGLIWDNNEFSTHILPMFTLTLFLVPMIQTLRTNLFTDQNWYKTYAKRCFQEKWLVFETGSMCWHLEKTGITKYRKLHFWYSISFNRIINIFHVWILCASFRIIFVMSSFRIKIIGNLC